MDSVVWNKIYLSIYLCIIATEMRQRTHIVRTLIDLVYYSSKTCTPFWHYCRYGENIAVDKLKNTACTQCCNNLTPLSLRCSLDVDVPHLCWLRSLSEWYSGIMSRKKEINQINALYNCKISMSWNGSGQRPVFVYVSGLQISIFK